MGVVIRSHQKLARLLGALNMLGLLLISRKYREVSIPRGKRTALQIDFC